MVVDGEVVEPGAVAIAIKPIPVDQAELDYAVIGEHEAAGGQRLLRVLLVAAQKEMLAGHLQAVRLAGTQRPGGATNPPTPANVAFTGWHDIPGPANEGEFHYSATNLASQGSSR